MATNLVPNIVICLCNLWNSGIDRSYLQVRDSQVSVNPLRVNVITFGQMLLHLEKCNYICKIVAHNARRGKM